MGLIKTVTIQLQVKTLQETDILNHLIYATEWIDVPGVLIGEPSSDEITNSFNMYGKQITAMLAIPKGDTNNWEDTLIKFNDVTYRTIGAPIEGIEANVPLSWHRKVRLVKYVEGED